MAKKMKASEAAIPTRVQEVMSALNRSKSGKRGLFGARLERYTHTLGDEAAAKEYPIDPSKVLIILLVGARRCGKTTLMVSMIHSMREKVRNDPNFRLEPSSMSMEQFDSQIEKLKDFSQAPVFQSGIDATSDLDIHDFVMYDSRQPRNMFMLRFIDVPGEWFKVEPEASKLLLRHADVVLFSINVPALMENGGEDCDTVNAYRQICQLSDAFDVNDTKPHLFIFVPSKCEKYYFEQLESNGEDMPSARRMLSVSDAINQTYGQLITDIIHRSPSSSILITPVLTMGSVSFDRIEWLSKENKEYREWYVRAIGHNSGDKNDFMPRYCEQPFLQMMRFIYHYAGQYFKGRRMRDMLSDAGDIGLFKAMGLTFRPPLFHRMKTLTEIQDLTAYETLASFEPADGIPKAPNGVYGDNPVLGIKVVRDPYNIYTNNNA